MKIDQINISNNGHNDTLEHRTSILSESLPPYDKEKYREMVLDAAETVLRFFGFDRTVYGNLKRNNDERGGGRRKWRWYEEIHDQRVRDIHAETL